MTVFSCYHLSSFLFSPSDSQHVNSEKIQRRGVTVGAANVAVALGSKRFVETRDLLRASRASIFVAPHGKQEEGEEEQEAQGEDHGRSGTGAELRPRLGLPRFVRRRRRPRLLAGGGPQNHRLRRFRAPLPLQPQRRLPLPGCSGGASTPKWGAIPYRSLLVSLLHLD